MTAGTITILWLALLAVLLIIEIATLGLTTIWFAGGALAALIASLLVAPFWLQVVLFLAVSLLLLVFTRPLAVRYMNKGVQRTNVETLPGKKGVVITEIDNMKAQGQVLVDGMEWSARSKDGKVIQEGQVVEVKEVEGVKLIVEEGV